MNNHEIRYSNNQIADAHGTMMEQVDISLGNDQETYFDTTTEQLPTPNFRTALYKTYGDEGLEYEDALILENDHKQNVLETRELQGEHWHNMRVAVGVLSSDKRLSFFPATIVPGGKAIMMEQFLINDPLKKAEDPTVSVFHDMIHNGLDDAYMMHVSNAGHDAGAAVNAAESRHGVIVAASTSNLDAHDVVHQLDRGGDFASSVGSIGLLNVRVGDKELKREPEVIDLDTVHSLIILPEFQKPQGPLFGLEVPSQELLIAGAFAAARTRGAKVNIGDNVSAMIEKVGG